MVKDGNKGTRAENRGERWRGGLKRKKRNDFRKLKTINSISSHSERAGDSCYNHGWLRLDQARHLEHLT